jgi:hypothetical protein
MTSRPFAPQLIHSLVVLGAQYLNNAEAKASILAGRSADATVYTVTGYSPAAQEVHIVKRGQKEPTVLSRAQFQKEYTLHRP